MRNNIFFFLFLIFFISCTPETVTGNDDESEQTNDNSADEDNVNDETDQTTGTTDDESEDNRDYKLVWQDLFDSEELDESVWNIEVNGNGGGNNELQYYSGNNVSIGAEPETGKHCLILTAKKETERLKYLLRQAPMTASALQCGRERTLCMRAGQSSAHVHMRTIFRKKSCGVQSGKRIFTGAGFILL